VDVSARIGTLELAETFVISRSARDSEDVVVVELRHSGVSGFGEAQPIDRYGESVESAQAYVEEHSDRLGDDPFALEEVMERLPAREFAARAALDAALHDLQGKLLGQPVWRLLGLRRAGPPTSWTVWLGDPDDMAHRAEKALDRFRRLKLKLGGGDGLDVERVHAVRGVSGDLPLQVDVNEAWSLDEALEALPRLAEFGVERISLLKLDIEGAEYEVLRSMLADGVRPEQLLVEFDQVNQPLTPWFWLELLRIIRELRRAGYRLMFRERANYLFVLSAALQQ